ncbi:MAG: tetratricopeptide repeat protein [Acidobacteria bacterium]|nr:tetratricopeptide repeat protein [Acidobacteriota bacterium]
MNPVSKALSVLSGPTLWLLLTLAALTAFVYAPVRHFDFVLLDDPAYVTENPHVARGLTREGIAWAFTTGDAANWHPVTWLSHMLDVQLFGVAAGPHHLTNVVLHIANTLLLFGVLLTLTGAMWRSAFVAALFAVHPLHVESVAWIAERKDVLSTLFWMLTLWAYVRYVRAPGSPAGTAGPSAASRSRRGFYLLMLAFFALGLMAKPMLVTLPFVLLLLDVWPLERLAVTASDAGRAKAGGHASGRAAAGSSRAGAAKGRANRRLAGARTPRRSGRLRAAWPLVREKLPLFVMAVASSAVTFVVQQRGGAVSTLETYPFGLRLQNALVSMVAYLRDTLWPEGLTVLYAFPDAIPGWQLAGALVVLGGISWLVYALARQHPYLPVGWLWYLGTLMPVVGLVQVGVQARADRYTYVPLIGIFVMVAWGSAAMLERLRGGRRVAIVAAVVVIAGCSVTTRAQVAYWKDNVTLFTRATMLSLHMDEFEAHMWVGTAVGGQGRLDEAMRHFEAAARLRPQSDAAHCSLGVSLAKSGRAADAMREFNEALRLNPDNQIARRAVDGLNRRNQF